MMNNCFDDIKNKYDVIIIGAGPAGLKCAETLQKSNLNILIIDKEDVIGKKVCAGGLTKKCIEYFRIPKNIIDLEFKEIIYHAPLIEATISKDDISILYTINRVNLANWQLDKIYNKSNITILKNSRAKIIDNNKVIINNKEIYFNYLVGADGSNSIVRKYLKLKDDDLLLGIQYLLKKDINKYKKIEIFFNSNKFNSFYLWIFPHKEYISIGVGVEVKKFSTNNLKNNLDLWLKRNNIDIENCEYEAFTINCSYSGYKFDNIFLVGDAAGLASKFTGEGIYQAMVSGEEIAKIILNKDYIPENLNKIIKKNRIDKNIFTLINNLLFFRNILFNLVGVLFKSKRFQAKIIKSEL